MNLPVIETEDKMANHSMKLFELELPDQGQLLFSQTLLSDLEEFQLFSRLPIELRIMIWRLSFPPGRKVVLELNPCYSCETFTAFQLQGRAIAEPAPLHDRRTELPHPVTLHTNRESRQETLKHYRVLFTNVGRQCPIHADDVAQYHISKEAVSVNPTHDTICLIHGFCDLLSQRAFANMDLLLGQAPGLASEIQSVEVRNIQYNSISPYSSHRRRWSSPVILEQFSHLKEVTLVDDAIRESVRRSQYLLGYFYEEYKRENPEFVVPEILIGAKVCFFVPGYPALINLVIFS